MPDDEYDLTRGEDFDVLEWRRARLRQAGYSDEDAVLLAELRDVDLHRAVELVRSGCPAERAVAILL